MTMAPAAAAEDEVSALFRRGAILAAAQHGGDVDGDGDGEDDGDEDGGDGDGDDEVMITPMVGGLRRLEPDDVEPDGGGRPGAPRPLAPPCTPPRPRQSAAAVGGADAHAGAERMVRPPTMA